MLCSAGMMIVNKLVLRVLPLPFTVIMIQMGFTVVALCFAPCLLHFGSRRDVLRWACTIPWLFAAMLATSMLALSHASMGAIVVIRNVAPLISIGIEGSFTQEKILLDRWTLVSLLTIIAGVLLYFPKDLSFSPLGMMYMLVNMTFAVVERILQRKMIAVSPIDVSKYGMMMLNNAVSLLPIGVMLAAAGEWHKWHKLRNLSGTSCALLVASCVNAVAISWAGINCQAYVTATSFLVLSNVNKFIVIGFGIAMLHESKSPQAILGCCVALGGGVWYGRARSRLASASKEESAAAKPVQQAQNSEDEAVEVDEKIEVTQRLVRA